MNRLTNYLLIACFILYASAIYADDSRWKKYHVKDAITTLKVLL